MKLQVNNIKIASWKKKFIDGWSFSEEIDGNLAVCGLDNNTRRLVLMCLAGCLRPNGGSVYIEGKNIYQNLDWYKKMVGIGEIKKINELYNELSVWENIKMICQVKNEVFSEEKWLLILSQLGIERYRDTLVGDCDLLVRSLVGVICALIGDPKIIFLDQPVNDLSIKDKEKFWMIFRQIYDKKLVIFTTNDEKEIEWMGAKIIDLNKK